MSAALLIIAGYVGLTAIAGLVTYFLLGADGVVVPLFVGVVSIISIVTSLILWFITPCALIGPMTKAELEVWREKQNSA
ncbi:MAG: hypothetical protein AAFW47_00120 [Pseudomonadota bacterium]